MKEVNFNEFEIQFKLIPFKSQLEMIKQRRKSKYRYTDIIYNM